MAVIVLAWTRTIGHKAIAVGAPPEMILAGRKINDGMGAFIAEKTISEIVNKSINPISAKITIMINLKENCPVFVHKVLTIIEKLNSYNQISVTDSWVVDEDVEKLRY